MSALACLLSACGGLDPAVEGSAVFTAEWPGGFVFDDSALLQEPSDDALARFAAYVQNGTQTEQRLVVIDRFGLSEVDFDGLSGQYSSVSYQVAGDGRVRTLDRSDCARWLAASRDP